MLKMEYKMWVRFKKFVYKGDPRDRKVKLKSIREKLRLQEKTGVAEHIFLFLRIDS
jgi:hypothetical protein